MATVKIGRVRVSISAIATKGLARAYMDAEAEERTERLGRLMAEREGRLRGTAPDRYRCPICGKPKADHDPTCCAARTPRGRR